MPQSLQYVQPLFVEERTMSAWSKWLVRAIAIFMFLAAAAEGTVLLLFWRKLPYGIRELTAGAAFFFVALPIVLSQTRALIILEPAALQLRLAIGGFSLWNRTIRVATIKSVEQAPRSRARSVLRFAPRMTQFMTGASNVLLKVDRGTIEIGSAKPEEFLETLQRAVAKIAEENSAEKLSETEINSY